MGALSAFKRVEVRGALRGPKRVLINEGCPQPPHRRPKYLTGAQKRSTKGRPTGAPQIEVMSALRAPPKCSAPPPPRGGGGGDRYATDCVMYDANHSDLFSFLISVYRAFIQTIVLFYIVDCDFLRCRLTILI